VNDVGKPVRIVKLLPTRFEELASKYNVVINVVSESGPWR
jgi:hypothetical protein